MVDVSPPQVLTVGTTHGSIHSFLSALPVMGEAYGSKMVMMTGLAELTVMDVASRMPVARVTADLEPAFCGLGPAHLACGMNNKVRGAAYRCL